MTGKPCLHGDRARAPFVQKPRKVKKFRSVPVANQQPEG